MNPIEAMTINLKTAMIALNNIEVKGVENAQRLLEAAKIINGTINSLENALKNAKKEDGEDENHDGEREDV